MHSMTFLGGGSGASLTPSGRWMPLTTISPKCGSVVLETSSTQSPSGRSSAIMYCLASADMRTIMRATRTPLRQTARVFY